MLVAQFLSKHHSFEWNQLSLCTHTPIYTVASVLVSKLVEITNGTDVCSLLIYVDGVLLNYSCTYNTVYVQSLQETTDS